MSSSGLTLPCLKLTLLANFGRGPYKSGKWGLSVRSAAESLMSAASEDYLEEISEAFNFDQGRPAEEPVTRDRFLETLKTRIPEEGTGLFCSFLVL